MNKDIWSRWNNKDIAEKKLIDIVHNRNFSSSQSTTKAKYSFQVPLSSQMVDTMWVGARTFPLLIAELRSSGTVGGTKSLTGIITFLSTCKHNPIGWQIPLDCDINALERNLDPDQILNGRRKLQRGFRANTSESYVALTVASKPSKEVGTMAPASAKALFLACADSSSPPLLAPCRQARRRKYPGRRRGLKLQQLSTFTTA